MDMENVSWPWGVWNPSGREFGEEIAGGHTIPVQRSSAGNLCVSCVSKDYGCGIQLLPLSTTMSGFRYTWGLLWPSAAWTNHQRGIMIQSLPLPWWCIRRYQQLYFPFFCLLFATSVVGRGCSQPAHGMQQLFSEDELSFTWDSLQKALPCRAQMPPWQAWSEA